MVVKSSKSVFFSAQGWFRWFLRRNHHFQVRKYGSRLLQSKRSDCLSLKWIQYFWKRSHKLGIGSLASPSHRLSGGSISMTNIWNMWSNRIMMAIDGFNVSWMCEFRLDLVFGGSIEVDSELVGTFWEILDRIIEAKGQVRWRETCFRTWEWRFCRTALRNRRWAEKKTDPLPLIKTIAMCLEPKNTF